MTDGGSAGFPHGPASLGAQAISAIVRHIDDPRYVRSLREVPEELVELILHATLAAGKVRSIAVLELFLQCGHVSVVQWLQRQNLGEFTTVARGVGLTPKGVGH